MSAARFEREVRNAIAGLRSSIDTRKRHPTYGVTKADLRQRLARLEGMLAGYGWLLGHYDHVGVWAMAVDTARRFFAVDLVELRKQVDEA